MTKGFYSIGQSRILLGYRSAEKVIQRDPIRQHPVVLIGATTLNTVQFLFSQQLGMLILNNLVETALGAFLLFSALLLVEEEG